MTKVFVFAYYSYKDPVFQSAVLPYLKYVKNDNLKFVLLTWEQKMYPLTIAECETIRQELLLYNIIWRKTQWHSGRFKLAKKAYDFSKGLLISLFLILKFRTSKIYSEGFPGAIFGHYLSMITRTKHVIHTFEPHAEYMLEAGVWTKKSWEYRLLKKLELTIGNHAEHIVTATHAYADILTKRGMASAIHVVPSCVDMELFRLDLESRNSIRKTCGILDETIVITYLGKMGGMYMEEELYEFFQHCMDIPHRDVHFFLFTSISSSTIEKSLQQQGIPKEKVLVKYLGKNEVGDYLSASDIAFCGVRPIPHQRFSSPIKNGEYWACGLPVIIPIGISDDYLIVEKEGIGISYASGSFPSHEDIVRLTQIDRNYIREKGIQYRSIHHYRSTFEQLFS